VHNHQITLHNECCMKQTCKTVRVFPRILRFSMGGGGSASGKIFTGAPSPHKKVKGVKFCYE
jgi:hypothetical protein